MIEEVELEAARDAFALFAVITGRDDAPLYERICHGAAEDPELLSLFATIRPEQRRPNLLLAAVHDLQLSGEEGELTRWYPTVALYRAAQSGARPLGAPESPIARPEEDPYPAFAAFCREHRPALEELLATRSTQTNEIGRCAVVLPALVTVAARVQQPLWLVELGASAGLNLLFDRFAYAYSDGTRGGDPGSPVQLESELREGTLPELSMPTVAGRVGLDQDPVDPTDERAARWLLACQWPDHPGRFSQLLGALDVRRNQTAPPVLVEGDMVEDLDEVVASVPDEAHLCLFHTWAAAYLAPRRQLDLVAAITGVGRHRPVSWLFAEHPFEVPALPVPHRPKGRSAPGSATALVAVELDGRTQSVLRLADAHHHGRWLYWWGTPPVSR